MRVTTKGVDKAIRCLHASTMTRRQALTGAAAAAIGAPFLLRTETRAQEVENLPPGMALVSSMRLPLFGVGSAQVPGLFNGSIGDWADVGVPTSIPVVPIALEGDVPAGMTPELTVADYDALAQEVDARPGSLALIPVGLVDFRVNVLAVDGFDPLRQSDVAGQPTTRVGVVGDIVPGRNVHNKMIAYGDFTHPFKKIAAELARYDVTIANLEGNLSATIVPPADAHTFSFVSDPAMIEGFKLAQIDAVSLANNHAAWNSEGWGMSALLDTISALNAGGLPYFGAGRDLGEARAPWVVNVPGGRLAIIGIDGVTANELPRANGATVHMTELGGAAYVGATAGSAGTNPYILDTVLADIAALATQYDMVIPYFHVGEEYIAIPPAWGVDGMRAAVDAGATMVVTNHPHVVQGLEIYNGVPIVYSVGNFIFDQMFAVDVRQGVILEIVLRGGRVVGLRTRGVEIEDFNQPRLMTAGEQASLIDRFWQNSDRLAGRT
jgi:poly-gamma-glutamate capsule biosynthesis protein CapA/YwtB (metallophosphatase superfamily)